MHMICRFEAWEVRNPWLQTVHDLDLKRRSYGHFKADGAECENAPSFKNGLRKSSFDCKMISKLQNGLLKCFYFSMVYKNVFLFPLAARHGLQAMKWPPSYKMICKNTLQSQGKLQKCQQSLTTMHLKKRVLSLRSHMKSLIPFLTS